MKDLLDIPEGLDRSVVTTDTPEGLSAIQEPARAAAIWHRNPLNAFQSWIDGLAPEKLPSSRLILRPELVCEALSNTCKSCGTPEGYECDLLVDDAAALAAIFTEMMGAPYLRVRLDVIKGNACRKFHVDALSARLICTYRGTGTQYGIATDGADPDDIMTVPTGSPMILRGTQWPETPLSGLVHRSPPIENTGETRLVLVLDPIFDPEGDPGQQVMH